MEGTGTVRVLTADEVSRIVVNAAMKIHSHLGPGLLESAYEACLVHELAKSGMKSQTQLAMPLHYDGVNLDVGYRLDVLVAELVIVEVKCVDAITPVHKAQLMSYLKLAKKNLGLILNFNEVQLKDGIKRIVMGTGWK